MAKAHSQPHQRTASAVAGTVSNARTPQGHLSLPACPRNCLEKECELEGRCLGLVNSLSRLVSSLNKPDSGVPSRNKETSVQHQDRGGGLGRDVDLISSDMRTGAVNVREGNQESMTKGQRTPGDTQASSSPIHTSKSKKVLGGSSVSWQPESSLLGSFGVLLKSLQTSAPFCYSAAMVFAAAAPFRGSAGGSHLAKYQSGLPVEFLRCLWGVHCFLVVQIGKQVQTR